MQEAKKSMSREKPLTVTGRLECHRDGYGFVIPENAAGGGDVFIPPRKMGNATHGDQVVAHVVARRRPRGRRRGRSVASEGKLEGEIIKVVSRAGGVIVGKVRCNRARVHVEPLDERYHHAIEVAESEAVLEGKIVAVSVVGPPTRPTHPWGRIAEVLGEEDDPEIEYKIVCHTHQIPIDFTEAALEEAEEATEPDRKEVGRRKDFRGQLTVTIDGETARDFDDAVSIEKLPDGDFLLSVHIADVSHYVGMDSQLDVEAFRRGTSVYFPDRSVPMLPHRLSNELCSLKPGLDRLTVSVVMKVDRQGAVRQTQFYDSIIRSDERMTYTGVKKILIDRDAGLRERYHHLQEHLQWMLELCEILRKKRQSRGAIDFDLPEAEIEYDVEGEILDIVRSQRNEAHRIIEEFMLLANEAVADCLVKGEVPLLFRVHEDPDPVKVEEFIDVARRFGYGLERRGRKGYESRDFQSLAGKLRGKREEKFLLYLMLRTFKQARYAEINHGHFGLATRNYTHFTSPIRRYPDLVVHRILKTMIQGSRSAPEQEPLYARLSEIALQSSERERKAMEAEREIMRVLMAAFMEERLGEEYSGFVIGVKSNGFFVELLDHFVEGFVPVETLWDDYYLFQKATHCLVGRQTNKAYRIGDQVRVRVDRVDRHRHWIDFSVVLTGRQSPRKR